MTNGFTIIAATTPNNGIGINNKLPWNNMTDMKYFRNITKQCMNSNKLNAVIMGRKTFASLNYIPLINRLNICITSKDSVTASKMFIGRSLVSSRSLDFGFFTSNNFQIDTTPILFFQSLESALTYLYSNKIVENIFVIGGATLYKEAIQRNDCKELLINEIECDTVCDTFFPEINEKDYILSEENLLSDDVINRRYIQKRCRGKTM